MEPEKRYEHFIEATLEGEETWSLEASGQLIRYRLQDDRLALPLWPSQELAALESPDASEQPRRIGLEELLDQILPEIASQNTLAAIFPQKGSSFIMEAQLLAQRLQEEWDEID